MSICNSVDTWELFPDPFPWHSWESFKGMPGKLSKTWMMLFVITEFFVNFLLVGF